MCERNIDQLPLARPQLGTWPANQACALTWNWTTDISVCGMTLDTLSHTRQGGKHNFFIVKRKRVLIEPQWWLSFTNNDLQWIHIHYHQFTLTTSMDKAQTSPREESYSPDFIKVVSHLALHLSALQTLPLPLSTSAPQYPSCPKKEQAWSHLWAFALAGPSA